MAAHNRRNHHLVVDWESTLDTVAVGVDADAGCLDRAAAVVDTIAARTRVAVVHTDVGSAAEVEGMTVDCSCLAADRRIGHEAHCSHRVDRIARVHCRKLLHAGLAPAGAAAEEVEDTGWLHIDYT